MKMKKIAAVILAAATVINLLPAADATAAVPRLGKKSVKLVVGSSRVIKVKNSAAKARVTWKSSNTKVVRIVKKVTKGRKASATIRAIAKGNAKITAAYKLKGRVKKLKCSVKVSAKGDNTVKVTDIPVSSAAPANVPAAAATQPAAPTATPQPTSTPVPTPTPTARVITANEARLVKEVDVDYNRKHDDIDDYGSFRTIKYMSDITNSVRLANVFLPADYDENDEDTKYPVVYLLHGIAQDKNLFGGSINSSIAYIAGNAVQAGLCKKFIIVCPNIRVSDTRETDNPDPDNPNEVKTHSIANYKFYDDFREDLINNLMPYMEENFNVAAGRENTGVCGFSMGGREGLYIGLSKPEYFGYVGGFCPAVGLLDYGRDGVEYGSDSLFGADENLKLPEEYANNTFVEIFAGKYDNVVNDEPKRYLNALTANDVPVLFYGELPYGHEARTYEPGFYNFIINAFAAD